MPRHLSKKSHQLLRLRKTKTSALSPPRKDGYVEQLQELLQPYFEDHKHDIIAICGRFWDTLPECLGELDKCAIIDRSIFQLTRDGAWYSALTAMKKKRDESFNEKDQKN